MEKSQDLLLELLKSALWQKPSNPHLFEGADWKTIYQLAKEQAVIALCVDGINLLPAEQMPPAEWKSKWISAVMITEMKNRNQNAKVVLLIETLQKQGLHPVLMKGQSLAVEYPCPLHRTCGDMDIYFKEEDDVEKAIAWTKSCGYASSGIHEHDSPFTWQGEIVELYYWMALLYKKQYNKRLQEIISEEYRHNTPNVVRIGDLDVETVPVTLYVLYKMVHISFHFLNEGIGLRQFCDLAIYLKNHHAEIDFRKLNKWIEELGMERLAELYATFLCEELGLDSGIIPWITSSPYLYILHEDIFQGGNFGKLRFGFKGKSSFLVQKFKALPLHYMSKYDWDRIAVQTAAVYESAVRH
ncbi:MAG: nucleotidyltransferase family protein [Prevotellaceae bacterium]|nr:nucleotidyltransferase family protein [Prevotellaceae bacterium]